MFYSFAPPHGLGYHLILIGPTLEKPTTSVKGVHEILCLKTTSLSFYYEHILL